MQNISGVHEYYCNQHGLHHIINHMQDIASKLCVTFFHNIHWKYIDSSMALWLQWQYGPWHQLWNFEMFKATQNGTDCPGDNLQFMGLRPINCCPFYLLWTLQIPQLMFWTILPWQPYYQWWINIFPKNTMSKCVA